MKYGKQLGRRVWLSGIVAVAAGAAFLAFVYLGIYDVAADIPHTHLVHWFLNTVRDRSVAVRAQSIQVPSDLEKAPRIRAGAGLYAEMCSGCHLGPGMARTEIAQGLYPAAPELAHDTTLSPAEAFWTIKHGIKMTGMAAWGKTHSDALIWDMVAFLQKLPSLSPTAYQALVNSAPADHDELMNTQGHNHGHDEP